MSKRPPPLPPPPPIHPGTTAPTNPPYTMASTQLPPIGPHQLAASTFLPPPQSRAFPLTQAQAFPNQLPRSVSHGPPLFSPPIPQGMSAEQSYTIPSRPSQPSKPHSAASLSNLLHVEPFGPHQSKPTASPKERMQISSQTILGPEQPPLTRRVESPHASTRTFDYPGRSRTGSVGDDHSFRSLPRTSPTSSSHYQSESPYRSSEPSPRQGLTASGDIARPSSGTLVNTKALSSQSRYGLVIRQQPIAARACGFGERDRRVIDPPPILQMTLSDFDPSSEDDLALLRWPMNVVHCALYSVPNPSSTVAAGHDVTTTPDPNNADKHSRRLMGTLVASPFVGTDPGASPSDNENARLGCFFIFHDLSCRQNGLYRLRFTLMVVGADLMSVGGRTPTMAVVDSDIFEVFSAKDFPGMRSSTPLTRDLKRQGANVQVKKGNEGKGPRKEQKRASTASEGSASDDDDQPGSSKPKKQRKR